MTNRKWMITMVALGVASMVQAEASERKNLWGQGRVEVVFGGGSRGAGCGTCGGYDGDSYDRGDYYRDRAEAAREWEKDRREAFREREKSRLEWQRERAKAEREAWKEEEKARREWVKERDKAEWEARKERGKSRREYR